MTISRSWLMAIAAVAVGAMVMNNLFAQPKPATTAQAPAPAATKIAVCDVGVIFTNYQKAKDLEMKFGERRNALKAEDDKRGKKIESIEQELREGLKANSKEYEDRLAEYTKLTIDRETWVKYEEVRATREYSRLSSEMFKDIQTVAGQVAIEKGFDVVLSNDAALTDQKTDVYRLIETKKVLYSSPAVDITNAVLAKLNEQYKAATK